MPSTRTETINEGSASTLSEMRGPAAAPLEIASAHALIERLRELPPFDPAVRSIISDLSTLVFRMPKTSPAAQKLAQAVTFTQELWEDLEGMGGQKHIALLEYGARLNYFDRTVDAVATSSAPPADTEGLFEADEYGSPLAWHAQYSINRERLERGYHNYALYMFAAQVDSWRHSPSELTLGVFDHQCFVALCDMLASGVKYDHPVIGMPEWDRKTTEARELIATGAKETAISLLNEFLTERVLAHLPEEIRVPELSQRVALRCYSSSNAPSEEIWRSITAISDSWAHGEAATTGSREGYTHRFSRAELDECVSAHNGTLLTLTIDNKVAYFGLCYSDPHHIPQITRQKIDAAVNSGFISSEKLDSWVFLVACERAASHSLQRLARHDWYSTFMDAIGDIAIGNGAERIMGRVLNSNSSKDAHMRAGAQSTHTHIDDPSGESSEILSIEYL